jgi:hypothetical protein
MDCFRHFSIYGLGHLGYVDLDYTIWFPMKIPWHGVLTWLFWTCDGQYNKIWSLMILIEESLMDFHGLGLKTKNINNNLNS